MRYINTKNGVVIDSPSIITGKNWEEVKPEQKKTTVKKETGKNAKEWLNGRLCNDTRRY